jgi:adenylate cyclase
MSDVFISYARSTEAQAQHVAAALRALGYQVWRDDQLPVHRGYAEVIEERLKAARAVVVIWGADASKSHWVRAEADVARTQGTLVQLTIDGAPPPLPFNQIQCADLSGWTGDTGAAGWLKVAESVAALTSGEAPRPDPDTRAEHPAAARPAAGRKASICVLPFANMSGDPEQEYFSDGICEDIMTDLSKVSSLFVVARNTAFTFKGRAVDVPEVARRLGVSHVLEGSVRKAGGRVRINAQLIDGLTGGHVWAERWDRDLTDIFALQDEIGAAIVAALKLKLLPQEKQALGRRGTESVEAYNLYLMARQARVTGNDGDLRKEETIVRLCRRATEIDPNYAAAWALLAKAEENLRHGFQQSGDGGMASAERALALDPDLADAHAVKANLLQANGLDDEATAELAIALRLEPDSYEVNRIAGVIHFRRREWASAIRHWEKAGALLESDYNAPTVLIACYTAVGDREGARRAARLALARTEAVLAHDASNGHALSSGVAALATLGDGARAREWIARACLIDPTNMNMRYNFACALTMQLGDTDAALELLAQVFPQMSRSFLAHVHADPDLDGLRADPRFQELLAAAEARLRG